MVFITGITSESLSLIGAFVSICKEYTNSIPLVLVLGLTSCIETFYHYMPHSAISTMNINKIALKSPDECLDVVVEEVRTRMSDVPLINTVIFCAASDQKAERPQVQPGSTKAAL